MNGKIILLCSIFSLISISPLAAMYMIQPITTKKDAANVFNAIYATINGGDITKAQSSLEQFKLMSKRAPAKVKKDANEYIQYLDETLFLKTINLQQRPTILYEKAIAFLGKGQTGKAIIIMNHLEMLQNQRPANRELAKMLRELWYECGELTIGGEY